MNHETESPDVDQITTPSLVNGSPSAIVDNNNCPPSPPESHRSSRIRKAPDKLDL